jgi:arylsulfatase A-like enzyme
MATHILQRILVSCLLLGLMACAEEGQEVAVGEALDRSNFGKPNIVFIIVDDLGWNDVGYHGSEIHTPNIDALAARGVILDRSYVFPICSPTRAALMTGRNPLQFGIDQAMENDAMLPAELTLLPEHLKAAGYTTWMVGKWHLGMSRQSATPPGRGFDYFYGHLGGFVDFYTHVYFGGLDWQRNGQSVREEGYSTDLLTSEAINLVQNHSREKPFFLYLSYNAPHTPLQYPPAGESSYSEIADPDRRVFAQMTTYLDNSLGLFLDALDAAGESDNTVVVFMSDNGGNMRAGAHNGELRGGKGSALEGGIRSPTLISWPRSLDSGATSLTPIFVQDWLPTLLDIADAEVEVQNVEGISLWPTLMKSEELVRDDPILIGVAGSKAVFDWPWKLVRDERQRRNGSPVDELYNVVEDPYEKNNLAGQYPERVANLTSILDELPVFESKGAKGPKPETLFRGEDGKFDYDVRLSESREPWAESASVE